MYLLHTKKKKKSISSTGLCLKRLLGYTQTIPLHIKDYSTENKKEIQIQIPLPRNVTCPGIFYFSWYYVIFFWIYLINKDGKDNKY